MDPPPHVRVRLAAMAEEEAMLVDELIDRWRAGHFAAELGMPETEEARAASPAGRAASPAGPPPKRARVAAVTTAELDDETEDATLLSWRLQMLPTSRAELIKVEGKQLAPKPALNKAAVPDVLAWMERDRVVGLCGEPSTGKTAHVRAFAAAHRLTIVDVDVHESRDAAREWLELAVCRGLDPKSQGPRLWVLDGWDELLTDKGGKTLWARELETEWIPKMLRTGRVVLTSTDTSRDVRDSAWPWLKLKKLDGKTSMQILRRCCAKFGLDICDAELERLVLSTSDVGTAISMLETFHGVPAAADARSALPPHNPRDLVELGWRESSPAVTLMLEAEDSNTLLMLAQETAPAIACRAWGCGKAHKGGETHGAACVPEAMGTAARLLDVCSGFDLAHTAARDAALSGPLQAALRASTLAMFHGGAVAPMDVPVPRILWGANIKRDAATLAAARKARGIEVELFRDKIVLPAGAKLAKKTTYVAAGKTGRKFMETIHKETELKPMEHEKGKFRMVAKQTICENFDWRIDVLRDPRADMIGVFKESKGVWS